MTGKWWKLPLEVFGVFAGIVSVLVAVLTFLPKLSVDSSGSLRPADPMGTVFYLSNDGLLPIHDITAGCGLDDVGNAQLGVKNITINLPESYASILSPGHKMTLPCAHAVEMKSPPPDVKAKITVRVKYRPDWVWWHRNAEFPLEAERVQNGNWLWKNIPR